MSYEALWKIYYKNNQEHEKIYRERYLSPFARHLDIEIRQYNHEKSFQAFYNCPEDLMLLIERIYRKNQQFLTVFENLPSVVVQRFNVYCVIDEVHSTSAIEGIHSTHRELQEIIDGNSKSEHFSSIIKKYEMLVQKGEIDFETSKDVRLFYDEFVSHDVISDDPKDRLDGKVFRASGVDIRSGTGKILHSGFYPEERIIEAMDKALEILHNENIPILIRIALFHYLFVYIHPFYNGNGRTARFISSYYLAKNFHYLPALRLSYIIKSKQKSYYEFIHNTEREWNCGDLTPFILWFCSVFEETFDDVYALLSEEAKRIYKYEHMFLELFPEDKLTQDICLNLFYSGAFSGEGMTMEELMRVTEKSRNTLKNRLNALPEGLLEVSEESRTKKYKLNRVWFCE